MAKLRKSMSYKKSRKSSRKSRKNSLLNKSLKYTDKGLKVIGSTTTKVVKKSIPIIEEGSAKIYDTFNSGLDMSVKTAKKITPKFKSISRKLKIA